MKTKSQHIRGFCERSHLQMHNTQINLDLSLISWLKRKLIIYSCIHILPSELGFSFIEGIKTYFEWL